MAGQIEVDDAEVLAQQLAVVTATLKLHSQEIDELAQRVEVLEDERARRRAEGGA